MREAIRDNADEELVVEVNSGGGSNVAFIIDGSNIHARDTQRR